jgi:BolA protein
MEAQLRAALTAALSPVHLEIVNESSKHSVPVGSESHFKVLVVSAAFEGKSPVARHRAVNSAVAGPGGELPVHALSVSAKTPQQWAEGEGLHATPNCKGGAGL